MGEMTGGMTGGIKTLSRAKPPMYKGVSRNDGRDEGFFFVFRRILQSQHENTSISTREYCNPNAIILLSRSKLPAHRKLIASRSRPRRLSDKPILFSNTWHLLSDKPGLLSSFYTHAYFCSVNKFYSLKFDSV